jgi:NAD(P)-dependent dehydrogenase (short-subunit alcohol dehydrogenase family)
MKDRVALVTGAGGGLGRSHAIYLAKQGVSIVVNDICQKSADETVKIIKNSGGNAYANYLSGNSIEAADEIIREVISCFNRIDIVVHSAGILKDVSFNKQNCEDWREIMAVHLDGPRNITKAAWEIMKQQNYGRIIMTTSASGLYGNFGQSNYAAAKLGILGFVNALKEEGQKYNIKINAIAPVAYTQMTAALIPDNIAHQFKPEYVSPVVTYFSSEQCDVSGQCWAVGAGYISRVVIAESKGHYFDLEKEFNVDDIHRNIDKITDYKNFSVFEKSIEQIPVMLKNAHQELVN